MANLDTLKEIAPVGPTVLAAATPTPGASNTPAGTTTPSKAEATPVAPAAEVTETVATTKPAEPAVAAIEHTPIKPKTEVTSEGSTAQKPDAPNPSSGLMSALQVGGALAIVLGIIVIGRALMRKFMPGAAVGNGKGVMETLARYPIGRNQSVVLLRIGSQIVALNQTKEASQSILVISEPMEVAKIIGQVAGEDPKSIQSSFNRALSNARMDLENPGEASDETEMLQGRVEEGAEDDLDQQLEEMAAAKRQLMELRAQVRSVRDNLPA
jgi:flagellar biogenesis protein FliO